MSNIVFDCCVQSRNDAEVYPHCKLKKVKKLNYKYIFNSEIDMVVVNAITNVMYSKLIYSIIDDVMIVRFEKFMNLSLRELVCKEDIVFRYLSEKWVVNPERFNGLCKQI